MLFQKAILFAYDAKISLSNFIDDPIVIVACSKCNCIANGFHHLDEFGRKVFVWLGLVAIPIFETKFSIALTKRPRPFLIPFLETTW